MKRARLMSHDINITYKRGIFNENTDRYPYN